MRRRADSKKGAEAPFLHCIFAQKTRAQLPRRQW